MSVEFKIEGVSIKLTPLDKVQLKKRRLGGYRFSCACGQGLDIDDSDIKTAGSYETRKGHVLPAMFTLAKNQLEIDTRLQKLNQKADQGKIDFTEYMKELSLIRNRRRILSDIGFGGGATSLSIPCPGCGRSYKFTAEIWSDIQPGEELEALDAYRKLGIQPREEIERRLKIFVEKEGWKHGYDTVEDYLKHIASLDDDIEFFRDWGSNLTKVMDKIPSPESEDGRIEVAALRDAMLEKIADARRDLQRRLTRELQHVASMCKPTGIP